MILSQQQVQFVERRRRLLRAWPWVGVILTMTVAAFTAWLLVSNPFLVNPFAVAARLSDGSLEQTSLLTMAAILPLIFVACLVLLVSMILLGFAVFANEKRYLKMVDSLVRSEWERG